MSYWLRGYFSQNRSVDKAAGWVIWSSPFFDTSLKPYPVPPAPIRRVPAEQRPTGGFGPSCTIGDRFRPGYYSTVPEASASGGFVPKSMPNRSLRMSGQRMNPPEIRAICPWVKASVRMGSRAGIPDESTGLDTVRLFMSITSFRQHPRDILTISSVVNQGAGCASLRCHDFRSVLYAFFSISAHAPPGRLRLRINRNNLSPDTRCR